MIGRWEGWAYRMIAIVAVGTGLFWTADRTPPLTAVSDTVEGEVRAGGTLSLRSEVIRHRSCPLRVSQILVDGASYRHILDDLELEAPPGPLGHDVYRRLVQVRSGAVPGDSKFRIILSWRCNPVHAFWPITLVATVPFALLPPLTPPPAEEPRR